MHPFNMKWILKSFRMQSTINRHILQLPPLFLLFVTEKGRPNCYPGLFKSVDYTGGVNLSLVQYFKGSDTYKCLF